MNRWRGSQSLKLDKGGAHALRPSALRPSALVGQRHFSSHSRAGGSLLLAVEWIPACAGMTWDFPNENETLTLSN